MENELINLKIKVEFEKLIIRKQLELLDTIFNIGENNKEKNKNDDTRNV